MVRTPLNEDLVYLYIMGSLYKGEDTVVKVGIGKDATKRATEVGGEVLFRTASPQLRPITLYMEKILHLRLNYLYGYAKVRKRSGSREWFNCSYEQALSEYKKVRVWVLSESQSLSEIKALHNRIKRKYKGFTAIRYNPQSTKGMTENYEVGQSEFELN
tara:strand:- start:758 stop:1234 length:477 start_codon:yes stop_codon:yes gene_type:complete